MLESSVTYTSVLHLTTGENYEQLGSRIPGMWLKDQHFYIAFITGQGFNHDVPLNQKISFKMERVLVAGQSIVRAFIDQQPIYNQIRGFNEPFKNVKFYLGDPWHPPAPVKIFDLKYRSMTTKDKANP